MGVGLRLFGGRGVPGDRVIGLHGAPVGPDHRQAAVNAQQSMHPKEGVALDGDSACCIARTRSWSSLVSFLILQFSMICLQFVMSHVSLGGIPSSQIL